MTQHSWIRTISALAFLVLNHFPSVLHAQNNYQGPVDWEVGRVTFNGNGSIGDNELKDVMELEKGGTFLEWQLQEDLEAIRTLYVSKGFIDASIGEEREVRFDDRKVNIEIVIYEGQKIYVSRIEIHGVHVLPEKDVRRRLKLNTGDPLDTGRLDDFEIRIKDTYARRGYPYLVIQPEFIFSTERDSVAVVIGIAEGKITFLGDFSVVGNEQIEDRIILRALTVETGGIFNPEKLQESQENVYQIGLFKSVFFDLQGLDEQKDTLDLVVEVKEDDFRSFGFGVGYGSVQGIRTSGEWGQANVLDRAEKFAAKAEFTYHPSPNSSYNQTRTYVLSLAEPFFFSTRARSLWTASYQYIDYDSFDKVGVSGGLLLSRFYGRKKRISLYYLVESSDISNVDSTDHQVPEDILQNIGKHLRNTLEFSYVRDRGDDIFYPTTGDVFKLTTALAGGPLFGERDYYRITGDYARYRQVSVLGKSMILASHVKMGIVREFGTSEPVPPEEQFSIGGSNSLRGYDELAIGLLSDIEPRSGNYTLQINLESRFAIWRGLDGVFFFDTANIYNRDFFPRKPFLLSSAGIGIRYRTPIGPVRVEQAVRVDNNLGSKKTIGRLHISLGNPF